jgi:two-component system response regulator (stage 0 sporulation protein F)
MKTFNKVLIVEDEEAYRVALSEELKAEGISVLTANDGKSGMELALREHPDLIWLDYKLPIMNGIDMIREIRKDPWGKTARAVLLTQVFDPNVVADALENGIFKYFVKADHTVPEVIEETKKYFAELVK